METSAARAWLGRARRLIAAAVVTALIAACSLTPSAGPLAEGAAWQKTCPREKLSTFVSFDISKSAVPQPFGAGQDQYAVLYDAIARTAICSGHLHVSAFAETSADPVQLFDAELSLPGSTDNARYRRLEDLTSEIQHEVADAYNAAVSQGGRSGSDIVGQLRRAREYADQLGPDTHLAVVLVTDGLQWVASQKFVIRTPEDAVAYADSVALPKIKGELLFTGLGDRIDGKLVSTATVENLKAIYTRICERTGAEPCLAVTDYTSPVGSGS